MRKIHVNNTCIFSFYVLVAKGNTAGFHYDKLLKAVQGSIANILKDIPYVHIAGKMKI
jgi:hypothetical protein